MTLNEALQRWSDACTVEPASKDGKSFKANGNRRPLTNLLRHCHDAEIAVAGEGTTGWAALVLVTPAEPKQAETKEGEAPLPKPPRRQPFHLFVG